MNTAISYEGQLVGFAIPINDAKKIIISYQKYGRIVRPYLGVRYVVVDSYFATLNAMSIDYGALVIAGSDASELAVQKGSPAQTAGLVEGDIILEVEGKRIDKDNDLARVVSGYSPGDTLNLKVYHEDKEITLQVTLAEFPN